MEHQQLEWSPTHGWMALASYNAADRVGQINFFTHTGSQTEDSVCTRSSRPTSLAWHTSEAVLAGGWEDGKVVLVGPGNDFNLEISDEALQEIMCIRWNVQGTHLCVADKVGTVIIFRVELRGGAKYTKQHTVELKEHATSICTRNLFEAIKSEKDLVLEDDVHDDDFENAMKERQRKIGVRLSQDQLPAREPCASMFIIGTLEGTIFGVAQDGTLLKVFKAETEIVQLYYLEQKSMVVALTIDYILYQILIASDHTGAEKLKAKLPGKPGGFSMELSDKGTLLVASSEKEIRVWDLIGEENYTLSLQSQKGFAATDTVTCVAFSKKKGVISGGTAEGKIATWRKKAGNQREQADMWKLQPPNVVGEKILSLKWSPVAAALAVNTGSGIHIMQDDTSIAHFRKQVAAVQNSQNHFSLVNTANGVSQDLKLPFPARGIHLADKQLVVWGLETVMTYDVQTSLATFQSTSFQCNATSVVFYNQNLYCLEADKVNVRTLQGTVKQIISLPEMEGDPCTLDLSKNWMVISTTNGFLRIYDLSRREAKQEYHSKYVIEAVNDFYKFVCVKLNSTGTRVACTFLEKMNELSDKILVWDAEADNIGYFSFDKGMTDQQEYEVEAELASSGHRPVTAAARKMEREQSRYRMMYHRPGALFWDETDSRFLVCEAVYQNPEMGDNQLLSMFVTAEHSIQLQDIQPRSVQCDQLIGVNVPQLYFMKKSEYDEEEIRHEKIVGRQLVAKTMREFAGLDGTNDENTKKAMLDFCLYLTLGHMDEAFKAIKFIKSGSVWEHMAVMAVKTRRLDVAQVCLGNMGLVRGSKALRKSQKRGDPPLVQCATLALHLGMMEEAESLYKSTGRYDLLNKFYQAQNAWAPAYETAEKHDRIHLRNTYYNHAMCLEANGAIEQAIEHYEKSETHNFEIPRMFVDNPKILESYVRRKRDPELQRWWARYLESIGELEGAVNFYKVANDHLSVVRIRCVQGEIDEAAKIAGESGDRAACYHLARNYEADGNYEQAVHFYTKAYAFSSAIRLAKEHDMKERLANLCLMAGGSDLVEAARYYEDLPGYAHKAVMLYHKAGMIGRALDLAFRTEQFSALDLIAKDLSPTTDATTLKRAAEFFTNNNNFEKAVELLCFAKDYRGAVDLCSRKNVRMTDKLAELLTPTKENTPKNEERKALLEEVAELCVQQGFYQFAAKKYTQAGDKLMAMRALLKSGDTGKIRFFANTARSKDIYILAANYLQTTDWRSDPEVTKDIESFYNKSQSHEHLASFYQTCAFMEIEDYRDFEGAAQALESAQKAIAKGIEKGTNVASLTEQQKTVTQYQNQIKKFQKIKGVYDSDPTDAVRQLHSFAEESTEDDLIRPSHIFALLIGHHAGKQNWSAAYRCIQQLKKQSPKLDLTTVVSADVLDQVCDEMKVERITAKARASDGESDGEAEVEFSYAMQRQQRQKESK